MFFKLDTITEFYKYKPKTRVFGQNRILVEGSHQWRPVRGDYKTEVPQNSLATNK